MSSDICNADFYQVVPLENDQALLRFQTVAPGPIDPSKAIEGENVKVTVVKDISIFISKADAKNLARLISEFIL